MRLYKYSLSYEGHNINVVEYAAQKEGEYLFIRQEGRLTKRVKESMLNTINMSQSDPVMYSEKAGQESAFVNHLIKLQDNLMAAEEGRHKTAMTGLRKNKDTLKAISKNPVLKIRAEHCLFMKGGELVEAE